MKIACSEFEEHLAEGTPETMRLAAEHAATCPSCMETFRSWNELSDIAGSMHVSWKSDLLWPRIERAIRQGDVRPRPKRSDWLRIAAAVALIISLGAMITYTLRLKSRENTIDMVLIRQDVIDEVERKERDYEQAIKRLEEHADAKLEGNTSPLMVSYKEKLMLLDDAIAECQASIEENRNNAHVRKQLLTMYSEKQRTLQSVLREESNATRQ